MTPSPAHLIARASDHFWQGNYATWRVCAIAAKVVGCYERGATLELAQAVMRSPDTIGNYAFAWNTFSLLRANLGDCRMIRELRIMRHRLSYLHFCRLGRKWVREEFNANQAFAYLVQAITENLSPEGLDLLIEADYPSPKPRPEVVPALALTGDTLERLRRSEPGAYVVVLPGFDWRDGDLVKVTKARKSR